MSQPATKIESFNPEIVEQDDFAMIVHEADESARITELFSTRLETMTRSAREHMVRRLCPTVKGDIEAVTDWELFELFTFAQSNGLSIVNGEAMIYKRWDKKARHPKGTEGYWGVGTPIATEQGALRKIREHPQVAHVERRLASPEERESYLQGLPAVLSQNVNGGLMLAVVTIWLKNGMTVTGEGMVIVEGGDPNHLAKSEASSLLFDTGLAMARATHQAWDNLKAIPVEDSISPLLSSKPELRPPLVDSPAASKENAVAETPDNQPEAEETLSKKATPEDQKLAADLKALRDFVRPYQIGKEDFQELLNDLEYISIHDLLRGHGLDRGIQLLKPYLDSFAKNRFLSDEIDRP